jgi:curved DNA-binding protein
VNIDPRNTVYKVLMVAETADLEVITAVYRTLARRYHPDLNLTADAAKRMAEISEAYAVLRDPVKRSAYNAELAKRRDRRATDRVAADPPSPGVGVAGQPVGPAAGSVIQFGRYRGWTLSQIHRHDPHFLEWLTSVPGGRQYREEIAALLGRRPSPVASVAQVNARQVSAR